TELRLVTPADFDGGRQGEGPDAPSTRAGPYYQLTHDYLVPVLRDWLQRKQRESWRGRAELTLAERTAQWGRTRDRRFLPSPAEYLRIELGVPSGGRTPD